MITRLLPVLRIFYILIVFLSFFLQVPKLFVNQVKAQTQLLAFPGAEGFGAKAVGGRGGRVIFVTSLADSGPGTLRAALEASGPRIVIFKTGGIIALNKEIEVRNPYVTIAGQTAPGDGIVIRNGSIEVETHDVIIRNIRMRMGDSSTGTALVERDGIKIQNYHNDGQVPYNVIIDHSSFSWGSDENVSIWTKTHDITIQWSISTESFFSWNLTNTLPDGKPGKWLNPPHGAGATLGGSSEKISFINNYLANNPRRNPLIQGAGLPEPTTRKVEVGNNLVYNWDCGELNGPTEIEAHKLPSEMEQIHVVNNYYKAGPGYKNCIDPGGIPNSVFVHNLDKLNTVYVKGNIGPGRTADTQQEWDIVTGDKKYQSTAPVFPGSGYKEIPALQLPDKILNNAGAWAKKNGTWQRDSIDGRAISSYKEGTGKFIKSQTEVGGYPDYLPGTTEYPADTDSDGMPDQWEITKSLDKNNASDANTTAPSGYTWIEEYINSLFPPVVAATATPTATGTPTATCRRKSEGDANCDDSIDLLDFEQFRVEYISFKQGTLSITNALSNFNGDTSVDLLDFEIFRNGYRTKLTSPTPSASPTKTPSPTQTPSSTKTPTPSPTTTPATSFDATISHNLTFAATQLNNTTATVSKTSYPQESKPNWITTSASSWTSGFFPGTLWQMYRNTNDSSWQTKATQWTTGLESQKNDTSTHDVGFIIYNSFGNAYKLTNNPTYKAVTLAAANSLASRYSPIVGCTKSWEGGTDEFKVIIDNMMNIELLFWAAKNGGDAKYYDMAVSHATKTMQNHIRPDGSVYQLVIYNPTTGAVTSKGGTQSYSANSVWARGQSWAIYGFTMSYRETKDTKFLDTARKAADYYLANIPADMVPYWDFKAPNIPNEPRDSSAAAITASGLIELSKLETDPVRKEKYLKAAKDIITSLSSKNYLAEGTTNKAILLHGTYNKNRNDYDTGLIWGDYYFLEALNRYQGKY